MNAQGVYMKMKSINEWRVLRMAVRGGLLNEDLAALKNMTVDQAEEVMKKKPDDYAKLMANVQRANAGNAMAISSLHREGGSLDTWGFYHMVTERKVSGEDSANYKSAVELVEARAGEWVSQGWIQTEHDGTFFYFKEYRKLPRAEELWRRVLPRELQGASQEEKQKHMDFHFDGSRDKVYFGFGLKDAEALKKAFAVCMDYFEKNVSLFRQGKISVMPQRTENFIYYLSGEGDKQKSRVESEVMGLLRGTGVEVSSETGTDIAVGGTGPSGNHLKANQLVLEVILSKLSPNAIKGLMDDLLKRNQSGVENSMFFSMWTITHTPSLKKYIEAAGIDITPYLNKSKENFAKLHKMQSNPRAAVSNGEAGGAPKAAGEGNLVLTPDGAPPMEIRIPLGVGSRIIKTPLAQRFMSSIQFNVVKRGNNWVISHHPEAVNITRLNDQPLSQPTPLSDGDVISFGKTGQVPIKVGFRK